MALVLADLLDSRNVKLTLQSRTAENAIRELTTLLAATEQVAEPETFVEQVIGRERTNPSVVEFGVALPHARTDLVDKIVLAIGRKAAGIPFGKSARRAKLIFLIGVPQLLVNDYLVAVGALARVAREPVIRSQLLKAATPEEFIEVLRAASSPEGGV